MGAPSCENLPVSICAQWQSVSVFYVISLFGGSRILALIIFFSFHSIPMQNFVVHFFFEKYQYVTSVLIIILMSCDSLHAK